MSCRAADARTSVFVLVPGVDDSIVRCVLIRVRGGIVSDCGHRRPGASPRRRRSSGRVVSGVQHEEACRSVGCCRECVRRAVADVHEAAFADRGHLAPSWSTSSTPDRTKKVSSAVAWACSGGPEVAGGMVQAITTAAPTGALARMTCVVRGDEVRRLCAAPGRWWSCDGSPSA